MRKQENQGKWWRSEVIKKRDHCWWLKPDADWKLTTRYRNIAIIDNLDSVHFSAVIKAVALLDNFNWEWESNIWGDWS